MCGIAFFVNYGNKKISEILFHDLFSMLSIRGTDSSGYYFERMENNILAKRILKAPIESTNFITKISQWERADNLYKFKLDGTEKFIMFHCRQKTRGTELDNKNNMPIYSKNYVLIHNGMVHNEKLKDYTYNAEVDSEEILARVETLGIQKGIKECEGSMAIAIKPFDKNFLYLYRNTNPIELVFLEDYNILIGCSSANYVGSLNNHRIGKQLFEDKKNYLSLPSHFIFKLSLEKKSIIKMAKISRKKD